MSSNPKVDLSNIRNLLKIFTEIKTVISTLELRDKPSNITYKVAPFLKMAGMYIPRSREIGPNGLNRAQWKIDHLLTTAEYFVDDIGFPYGTLPDYKAPCEFRLGDSFSVFTDVFGNILDVDDDIVNSWYDDVTSFPPKLYNEMNRQIVAELTKHHIPCDEVDETFGGLLAFQSEIVFRLVRQSMASIDQIVKAISELESRPIRNRRDITYMEGEAKILLTLKEMGTSRPKSYYDNAFQNSVLSILELQSEFGTGSNHIRAAQIFVNLRAKMRHPGVNRAQFFEKLHDIFPPSIGSSNAEQEANMVEVAYQASLPRFDHPRAAGRKENINPQIARSQIGKWEYARSP